MVSRSKASSSRVSILGVVLVLALALVAVAATAAQAYEWKIEGQRMVDRGATSESIASTGSKFTLTSKIGSTAVTLTCNGVSGSGSIEKPGVSTETRTLTSCSMSGTPEKCTVSEPLALKLATKTIEVGGVRYQRLGAKEGETLGMLTLKTCGAFNGSVPIKGWFAGEYSPEEHYNQSLVSTPSMSEAAGLVAKLGVNTATINAEVLQYLTGTYSERRWAEWTPADAGWKSGPAIEGLSFGEETVSGSAPITIAQVIGSTYISTSCSLGISGTISGNGGTGSASLSFSGCTTVGGPEGCTVTPGGSTAPATVGSTGTDAYLHIGGGWSDRLTTIKYSYCGGLSGTYGINGYFEGHAPLGSSLIEQLFNLSSSELHIGTGGGTTVSGTATVSLTGANAGRDWGVK